MAARLSDVANIPHEISVGLVNEVERQGGLRFVKTHGARPSPPATGELSPHTHDPSVGTGALAPEAAERPAIGEWLIEDIEPERQA
jgi:hypothetical protein